MTPNYQNTKCEHCNVSKPIKKSITSTLFTWLGFYDKCKQCGNISTKSWDVRAILLLVCTILCIQVLVSFIVYPILQFLVAFSSIQMLYFIMIHVLLIPFYLKAAMAFLLILD